MRCSRRSLLRLAALGTLGGVARPAPADPGSGPGGGHRDGTRFRNPGGARPAGLAAVLRWQLSRSPGPWPESVPNVHQPALPASLGPGECAVTLVNHATFLLQFPGLNILTDPIWSERCSPVAWAGPRRVHPPAITLDGLPRIDAVLVSHNHYDHLDLPTLAELRRRHRPRFVTGLGNGALLAAAGVTEATELDWWERRDLGAGFTVTYTPAQHFSARGLLDRDRALWGGFALTGPGGAVYFAGDSGYGDLFRTIGARLGPFGLALLPIGAYRPRWFMAPMHCDPAEAVRAHRDVGARRSLAMHFGCFPLADDGYVEPGLALAAARTAAGLAPEDFAPAEPGRTWRFPL